MKSIGWISFFIGILAGCLFFQLFWHVDAFNFELTQSNLIIVQQIRIPRFLMAFGTGITLAVCGFILQWLVQNPMADPYLLGTSGGASLGQVLLISYGISFYWLAVGVSFLFAFGASMLAFLLANRKTELSLFRLILSGLAISSLSVALSSALLLWMEGEHAVKSYLFWNFGGLSQASWWSSLISLSTAFVISILLFVKHEILLIAGIGVERAQNLGVQLSKERKILLFAVALAVAVSVTVAGPIGFVGLIVPHTVKQFIPYSQKVFLPYLILIGGVFLVFCDTFTSLVFAGNFPVGIITSFIGIPMLIYLIFNKKLSNY